MTSLIKYRFIKLIHYYIVKNKRINVFWVIFIRCKKREKLRQGAFDEWSLKKNVSKCDWMASLVHALDDWNCIVVELCQHINYSSYCKCWWTGTQFSIMFTGYLHLVPLTFLLIMVQVIKEHYFLQGATKQALLMPIQKFRFLNLQHM